MSKLTFLFNAGLQITCNKGNLIRLSMNFEEVEFWFFLLQYKFSYFFAQSFENDTQYSEYVRLAL